VLSTFDFIEILLYPWIIAVGGSPKSENLFNNYVVLKKDNANTQKMRKMTIVFRYRPHYFEDRTTEFTAAG